MPMKYPGLPKDRRRIGKTEDQRFNGFTGFMVLLKKEQMNTAGNRKAEKIICMPEYGVSGYGK